MRISSPEIYSQIDSAANHAGVLLSRQRRTAIGIKLIKEIGATISGKDRNTNIVVYDQVAPYDHVDYVGAKRFRRRKKIR